LELLHQEEMAHAREDEVPRHRPVVSDLEVVHAQFALLLLEALLYVPAVERHMEQNFKGGSLRGVGDKVFVLVRKRLMADEQPVSPSGAQLFPLVELRVLDLPHRRPFERVLDMERFPGLVPQQGRMPRQVLHAAGAQVSSLEARELSGPARVAASTHPSLYQYPLRPSRPARDSCIRGCRSTDRFR